MEVPSSAQEGVRRCDDLAMDSREDASDTTTSGGGGNFMPPSLRSGEHGEMGCRRSMEDASVCVEGIQIEGCAHNPVAFYGIFDGHGGTAAAEFVSKHLVPNITSDPSFVEDPTKAMRDGFLRTDSQLRGSSSRATTSGSGEGGDGNGNGGGYNEDDEEDCSGTTALCMCLMGGELIVANAGDCRAVMSRRGKAIDLSTDQRPTCSTELARIERAGGFVEDGYINGHLGVARAFGDFHIEGLKGDPDGGEPGPLIVEPEVERWSLKSEDEFIIVACDGLWDVFSSQNAVDFARQALRKHNDAQLAARELTAEALRRDSADNVSVIVVCFSDAPPPDKVQEKRTAPRGSFTRAISIEGLSELQKALKSDDEAAIVAAQTTPKLQRVNSINPRSFGGGGFGVGGGVGGGGGRGGMGRGMSEDFMGALDSMHLDVGGEDTGSSGEGNAIGSRRGSGDVIDTLSPLAEE